MKRILPWLIAAVICLFAFFQVSSNLIAATEVDYSLLDLLFETVLLLIVISFSFMGALVIVRAEGNRVGVLMMLAAIVIARPSTLYLSTFHPEPPTNLTPALWLILWIDSSLYSLTLLGFIVVFLIVLNFPNGRPPSSRWNWIYFVSVASLLLSGLAFMFKDRIGPLSASWDVNNPLGYLSKSGFDFVALLAVIGMMAMAAGSLISIFFRFRRAATVEREQIKWLLFAGATIVLAMLLIIAYLVIAPDNSDAVWQGVVGVPLVLSMLIFPLSIANAILRHNLWDINVIIRKTLIYTVITVLLAIVYFGVIILLQSIFVAVSGQQSAISIVVSTLIIATLFAPLRRRVQDFIDRRFYRRRYDAEKTLIDFSQFVRDETDMGALTAELLRVTEETMQPEQASIWLKQRINESRNATS
jgi:hypothetical protein